MHKFFHSPVRVKHHRLVGCGKGVKGSTMKGWPPQGQHLSLELSVSLAKLLGSGLRETAIVASSH